MPRPSHWRPVLSAVLVVVPGAAVGLLLSWALRQGGVRSQPWYCVVLAVLGFALFRIAKHALVDVEAPVRPRHGQDATGGSSPALLDVIERRLAAAVTERRLFLSGLRPMLRDLASERLRLHRGFDLDDLLTGHAETAREILGDDLWRWLTTTEYYEAPPPSPAELQRLVTTIEAL